MRTALLIARLCMAAVIATMTCAVFGVVHLDHVAWVGVSVAACYWLVVRSMPRDKPTPQPTEPAAEPDGGQPQTPPHSRPDDGPAQDTVPPAQP